MELLDKLVECLKNPISFEEAVNDGLIQFVDEPEYSYGVLKQLEEKHKVSTLELLYHLREDVEIDLSPEDVQIWVDNFRCFVRSGGNMELLSNEPYTKRGMDNPSLLLS